MQDGWLYIQRYEEQNCSRIGSFAMKKTEDAITERMVSAIKFQKRSRYEHEKKKEKQKSGGCPAIRFESTTLTIERIKEAPAIKRFEFIPLCRACHSRFALLSS